MSVKLSVFMSVYNGFPYLQEAIESVLRQTITDFEFVILNDGSTDKTAEYLNTLTDARVRVIHQRNKGLGTPLNKWMNQCRGEYIMRLDADDVCDSRRAEKQIEYLDSNPEVILVGCQYQVFSENGKGKVSRLPETHEGIVTGMLKGWHTLSHPTIMFRRSLLDHTKGYVFNGPGEDWSFLLDAALYGRLAVLPDVLYSYRIHRSSNAWKGVVGTLTGLDYARKRYQKFRDDQCEYGLEEFWQDWSRRGVVESTLFRMRAMSELMYREASLNKMEGKYVQYYCRLAMAAVLNANKAIGAIRKTRTRNALRT